MKTTYKTKPANRPVKSYNSVTDALMNWNYKGYNIIRATKRNDFYQVCAGFNHYGVLPVEGRSIEDALKKLTSKIDTLNIVDS